MDNNGCSGSPPGWRCDYNGGTIVQDSAPGSGATPPNSLRYTRTHNLSNQGGNYSVAAYNFPQPGLSSIYVGLWWKMSYPFYGMPICQNKLFLSFNEYGPGSPGKFYDVAFASPSACQNPSNGRWQLYGIMNYPQDESASGADGGQNIYGSGTFQAGLWHKLEVCHVVSTTPSSANGQYRIWLDGVLTVSNNRINYPGNFSGWSLNPVWDNVTGGSPGSPSGSTEHHFFDTVVLATGHTTCGTGTGGPTDQPSGPPAAPRITSVTVQ